MTIDGIVNLLLGLLLLTFPDVLVQLLGIPSSPNGFYRSILGAVLFGIGVALLLERFRSKQGGLALGGAIAINLCGGLVLATWLIVGELSIPLRGYVILWILVVLLIGLSALEFTRGKCNSDNID